MAAGGRLHFDDDYYVSRNKGNYTKNKMTPVWHDQSNGFEVITFIGFSPSSILWMGK
jgi:hypothetical protein